MLRAVSIPFNSTQQYGVRDVEKLLSLPRSRIRALIQAKFVSPSRGPRNAWRFSFQDLIVLRTAQVLAQAKVPPKRITRSLKALRRQLPETMPLSGLSITAVGQRVVVNDGAGQRQVESGQYLLAFERDPADGSLIVIERKGAQCDASLSATAEDWFDTAVALESKHTDGALLAYERAIGLDCTLVDAHINLGSLLHEARRYAEAEKVYRDAIKACGSRALLLYNLGVLLDDTGRKNEALETYEAALRADPQLADCHYNLALLYEELKKPKEAIRHMAQYRRLINSKSK
jgi:tetratricopeptide (TPR) repeat protein